MANWRPRYSPPLWREGPNQRLRAKADKQSVLTAVIQSLLGHGRLNLVLKNLLVLRIDIKLTHSFKYHIKLLLTF
jgi:hypothetical protein